jgi:hypothetical protein
MYVTKIHSLGSFLAKELLKREDFGSQKGQRAPSGPAFAEPTAEPPL